ncbi:hypothetical protein BABINDRAFT_161041 [Babjeviella inositovora NRRL Y-12698]|uniref:Arginase n=1 Tax=Babjeviella inositovora NRRL Y-12698 TaxID=984486 RepID=A0A1E3QV55_9ASCO|nr:uncharacterized protein BABINDRAFT_161041 [Babjeviella inositovora NRRL Y-12698]ODQ80837.1 hypothetical protein BABINDRAFT_161041 [Babjeviella inositovora NRRL Y-12698]
MESTLEYKYHPNKKATFVLAPFSGGQGKSGVEDGPEHLIQAGIESQIKELGWSTQVSEPLKNTNYESLKNDDSDTHGNCKRPKIVGEATQKVYEAVKFAAEQGTMPITLGGDHSIAIGTVAGVLSKYPNAGVLWIDAHADINTPLTTDSGNLHGCPVSFLMGLDRESYPPSLQWVPECLSTKKISYIGLRDIDQGEKKILREHGISAFSMYHVDKYGIAKVVEMAMAAVSGGDKDCPIHVSYDVDAIDPQFVPATGTPVRGGLTLREGMYIVEAVAETGNLVALDIVECNPSLGTEDAHILDTITAGCAIGRCALGETLL